MRLKDKRLQAKHIRGSQTTKQFLPDTATNSATTPSSRLVILTKLYNVWQQKGYLPRSIREAEIFCLKKKRQTRKVVWTSARSQC